MRPWPFFFPVAAIAIAIGCSRDPEIEERAVFVYSPKACSVVESEAFAVIYAGGDFEASAAQPPKAEVFLRDLGRTMNSLPKEARSLVVDISQSDRAYRGMTDIPTRGPVNVLVWQGGTACRLSRDVERRTEHAFGVFDRHFMVIGGRSLDGSQVPHTFVGDLDTGVIERLQTGLQTRRAWPTITAFRSPADADGPSAVLVAGGQDPETGGALRNAEVYVPKAGAPSGVGDFDRQRTIPLSQARTSHGAVVLATGETLLVGGKGEVGPLRTMEIVDPVTRIARTEGVAVPAVARFDPTVIRLASGEILVAGGDNDNGKVALLEWFASDGSRATKRPVDLVTGRARAIVPLEAGGALAVIVPPPEAAPGFKTVWVISADGTLSDAQPIDPTLLDSIRLFPGAEGAPVLWTGRRWMRWAPWLGAFQTMADAPENGPTLASTATGDSGLALWLDDRTDSGMNVTGFRFATRTRFDAVRKPLLVTGPDNLAPDRLAGVPGSSIRWDAERGLILGAGASAFLTDSTFADFDLEVDVSPNAAPANIVLRLESGKELVVGGGDCAFTQTATQKLAIKRRATRVDVKNDSAATYRTCPTELEINGRVSVGLRGGQGTGESGARNLVVTRR